MSLTRRQVMLSGLGLLVSCTPDPRLGKRPPPGWPSQVPPPRDAGSATTSSDGAASDTRAGPEVATPEPRPDSPPSQQAAHLDFIPRSRWTSHGARDGRVNRMGYINQITVHHEGWKQVYFTGWARTVQRLRRIRKSHVEYHGWGDLGYHFVIDRAGRVWEGRDLTYQGAHVSDHNQHNIGVMVLGNFQEQYPAQEQLDSLVSFINQLKAKYNINDSAVHTHQELGDTACPGRYLQPEMDKFRRSGRI